MFYENLVFIWIFTFLFFTIFLWNFHADSLVLFQLGHDISIFYNIFN